MLRSLSLFGFAVALSACGAGSRSGGQPKSASFGGTPGSHAVMQSSAPADDSAAAEEMAEPATPAPPMAAAGAESRRAYESEAPASRPGLGTEWGETRTSRVSSSPFERDDWSRPSAALSLFYNDAQGVQAMTRGAALSSFATPGVSIGSGALSVRLIDASGAPLPTYDLGPRTYVMGQAGERYMIEIQNHTGNRFEAVATVDGLDVIDGRPGAFEKRGYLIGPWQTVDIEGFRRSDDEVAAFRFGAVENSYAARKGNDRNVGVIGVAFFAERGARSPWLEREVERRHDADPFPGRFATPPR